MCICTYICRYVCICVCVYVYIDLCICLCICTCGRYRAKAARRWTRKRRGATEGRGGSDLHAPVYMCKRTHMSICMYIRMYRSIHPFMYIFMFHLEAGRLGATLPRSACKYMHVNICINWCTHTYIRIYIHMNIDVCTCTSIFAGVDASNIFARICIIRI